MCDLSLGVSEGLGEGGFHRYPFSGPSRGVSPDEVDHPMDQDVTERLVEGSASHAMPPWGPALAEYALHGILREDLPPPVDPSIGLDGAALAEYLRWLQDRACTSTLQDALAHRLLGLPLTAGPPEPLPSPSESGPVVPPPQWRWFAPVVPPLPVAVRAWQLAHAQRVVRRAYYDRVRRMYQAQDVGEDCREATLGLLQRCSVVLLVHLSMAEIRLP